MSTSLNIHNFLSHKGNYFIYTDGSIQQNSIKKGQVVWYHLHVESKIWYKWTYLQTETDSQMYRTNMVCLEFGISRYKLLYMKQINNKGLLYSLGNYIQYLVINYNRKEKKRIITLKKKNNLNLPPKRDCFW